MATISNNEIKIKYTLDTTDLANATALFDRLSAEDRQLLNDLKRLQAQLTATGQAGQAAGNNISNGTNKATESTDALSASIKKVDASISGLGRTILAVFSAQQLMAFGKSVIDTAIKMQGLQKAIEFTAGSAVGGAADFIFLQKIAEDLGLQLESAAEGFKNFSAAAARSGVTMSQQREMFTDLSKAMSALQLDAQSASLVFFGFGQLMAKEKVSAQELYHQIGERLPIAMQAAQIAVSRLNGGLEISAGKLIKMIESGQILSRSFAPEFTKALGELANSGAYVETLGKETNRLSTAWEEFKAALADDESLKSTIKLLKSFVEGLTDVVDAANYYSKYGLFPEKSYKEFKKFEKAGTDAFDKVVNTADTRFKDLINLNDQYQKSLTDKTEGGNILRMILEGQFNKKRQEVVKELADNITREEELIKKKQLEISKISFGYGPSTNKERKKALEQDIKIAEGAKAAFEKLFGTVPKLARFTPDPEEEERARKKREKALEDAYRKELARLESQKKAKEDIIKSEMMDGTLRDIEIAKNNEYWAKEMFSVDTKYAKMGVELARNNRVEREAQIKMLAALQEQLVEQANEKALQKEKEYHDRAMETLQDQQRKRKEAMQTDEQNELDADKDFFDDKIRILTEKYKEAISIEAISLETSKKLTDNYQKDLLALEEGFRQSQADIAAKYRQKEKALLIESELEVRSIVVEAANIRNQALARTEKDRADIEEEAAITQIKIEKERNFKLAQLQLQSTTLSDAEKETVRERQIANEILLDAKLTEIVKNGEKRRLEYKLEIANATFNALSQISNSLVNLYESNLSRERDALAQKYDSDVRLAGDNKQKLAQLAQQKARAEYEIELKQFKARQIMAVAEVIFKTAPEIAKWISTGILSPVAAIGLAAQGVAIGAILAQQPPVPPYKDGTKGRPHPGGPALVGEAGVEKVITTEGKVYYTPPMATLVDLPKGAQVIPNHALSSRELFWANAMNDGKPINPSGGIERKLDRIGGILESLPIHQINMNEKGFEKFVRTPRRTTKILNNQFPLKH